MSLMDDARLIAEIEAALAELEEAEELIRKGTASRVYIGFSGGIMIEVEADKALEYIEARKARLRALLEAAKKRREGGSEPSQN